MLAGGPAKHGKIHAQVEEPTVYSYQKCLPSASPTIEPLIDPARPTEEVEIVSPDDEYHPTEDAHPGATVSADQAAAWAARACAVSAHPD